MVMRLPSRSRATSLPSLTARRPNVDSAIPVCRQDSDIWLRSCSYFIEVQGGQPAERPGWYHHLPTNETLQVPGFLRLSSMVTPGNHSPTAKSASLVNRKGFC